MFADEHRGDARMGPKLLALLDERHAIYDGVDSLTVARMRAALLSSVGQHSLSAAARPFVLEELESAYDPRLTAVAAAILRKSPEPTHSLVRPLLDALSAVHSHDTSVEVGGATTTATQEIIRSLRWLTEHGAYSLTELRSVAGERLEPSVANTLLADVAEGSAASRAESSDEPISRVSASIPPPIAELDAEDHSGVMTTVGQLLGGRTTFIFFFFTRCGNAMKCPLTVTRLAQLQRRIADDGLDLGTVAFTYDPEYDTAERLLFYARSWGAVPSPRHPFARIPHGFKIMREFLELGVGYGPGGVNRHQLEAFVVDKHRTLVGAARRRLWTEDQLLSFAREVG
jgi:protein SCO1/2